MRASRFVLLRVERRHPVAGLIVSDLARDEEFWLLDEGMEKTVPPGFMMATRVYSPEDFFMAAGVSVPLDGDLLTAALMSRPHLYKAPLLEAPLFMPDGIQGRGVALIPRTRWPDAEPCRVHPL